MWKKKVLVSKKCKYACVPGERGPERKRKVWWIRGSGLGIELKWGELRRKRGIPLVGQTFRSPSNWSVSDGPFVLRKAVHSSKAAIKSRTFSPIIPLTWTPTPNSADVPVSAFVCPVAHFYQFSWKFSWNLPTQRLFHPTTSLYTQEGVP